MNPHASPGPLHGLKVVELGTLIAGPYCARLLAEFGAEMVKIETPGAGDPLRVLEGTEVPSGRINSIADIVANLHYQARGMVERHKLGERDLLLPGVVPKLSETPGGMRWIGPKLGEHTDEVLRALGYEPARIVALRGAGVIA